MPTFSNNNTGTHQYTIPAGAYNVTFSVAAAGGGGSKSPSDGSLWNHGNGGGGRAGNFSIATRSYAYTLTFYIGGKGGDGVGPQNPGGSGGFSPVAGGGTGHRSGGGGGGASAVYDAGSGRYIAWCGGGGGAGRFGQDTGISGYYTAGRGIGGGRSSLHGLPSWRAGGSAPAGHRGGGGGGSNSGGAGGLGGTSTTNGYGGIGGNSGWYDQGDIGWVTDSGYLNQGNGWLVLSYEFPPPEITYFRFRQNGTTSATDTLVEGETVDIEWAVNGDRNMSSIFLTGQGQISTSTTSQSFSVTPQSDTSGNIGTKSYTLTVNGAGGQVSSSITATIYEPPSVTLTSNAPDNTIIQGQQVTLTWAVTGYASTAQLSPNLGLQNISGNITLSPTESTTYTITVGGLAGTASAELPITVNQPPGVELIAPSTTDYGNDIILEYDYTDSEEGALLMMSKDGGAYIELDAFGGGSSVAGDFIVTADQLYDDFGPRTVQFRLTVYGVGSLQAEGFATTTINIDELPDQLTIPASEDKFLDEEPVITPDAQVTSENLVITDIDIPVEIKSDTPIQVEIDDDGTWRNIREIS